MTFFEQDFRERRDKRELFVTFTTQNRKIRGRQRYTFDPSPTLYSPPRCLLLCQVPRMAVSSSKDTKSITHASHSQSNLS